MLSAGLSLILANLYGIFLAAYYKPLTLIMLAVSSLIIALIVWIEVRKKDILLESYLRESYLLFASCVVMQVYFAITAFALLVYLNQASVLGMNSDSKLSNIVAGLGEWSQQTVESVNLSYYFLNFFLFMYYIRCFYVMFWRDNIVFIFRYLKQKVKELNQSLLSHLPQLPYSSELKDCICSLCLEDYSSDEAITRLHCKHVYHLNCIKVWVMRSNCCPLCRKRVIM